MAFGLSKGAGSDSVTASGPRTPLRVDLTGDLVFGLTIAFAVGLPALLVFSVAFAFAVGVSFGVASALTGGITFGLTKKLTGGLTGGLAAMRYFAFTVVAACRRQLPIRVGARLDWMCAVGLLRVSGIAYQLRHRELQVWLADHPDPL